MKNCGTREPKRMTPVLVLHAGHRRNWSLYCSWAIILIFWTLRVARAGLSSMLLIEPMGKASFTASIIHQRWLHRHKPNLKAAAACIFIKQELRRSPSTTTSSMSLCLPTPSITFQTPKRHLERRTECWSRKVSYTFWISQPTTPLWGSWTDSAVRWSQPTSNCIQERSLRPYLEEPGYVILRVNASFQQSKFI